MNKKIFRRVRLIVLLYLLAGIALYYAQESLIFRPVAVDRNTKYDFGQPYTELNLPYDKETNLNIIQFRTADTPARGVVLYFHGNKQNITRNAKYATDFTGKGYEVWMMDYPGYGKSTGKITEKNLYAYALLCYKLARSRWNPSQIILYGKSLGTGIAAQLASVRDCRRLIMECPYYSLECLARHYAPVYPVGAFLHYHFPTDTYLKDVTAPVSIFHGTSDGIIPYSNSELLKPLLKTGDEFITIEGGSHDNLHDYPLFRQKLDSLMAK